MADTPCPDRATLTALSVGRLAEAELLRWAPHVETCAACQAALAQIERDAEPDRIKKRLQEASAAPAEGGAAATPPAARSSPASRGKSFQLPAGTHLGEYELLDKIGAGGMGQVYKARHRRMNRVVALKVMSPEAMHDDAAVKRFQREVHAAARLEHPNIVTAHDAGEADGIHFLVMQFVDGADLASLVKREGPLSIERAVDYVCQAAEGLAYAHAEGVIHRDIKPANLLVDRRGAVKILDMGLARLENLGGGEALTGTEQVMGTVDYMSPEQAADTKHVDARADVYSLGCTLWYLLSGRRMYDGDTLVQRLMKHRDAPSPSLVKLRDDATWPLEQVFHKMVAKQAKDRYPTMAEVIAALTPYRGDSSRGASRSDYGASPPSAELASFLQTLRGKESTAGAGPSVRSTAPNAATTAAAKSPDAGTDPQTQTLLTQAAELRKSQASASGPRRVVPRKRRKTIGATIAGLAVVAALVVALRKPSPDQPPLPEQPVATSGAANPSPAVARTSAPPPAVAPFDAATARKHQEAWAAYLGLPVTSTNSNQMPLTVIPPGEFMMGAPPEETARLLDASQDANHVTRLKDSEPQHPVTLTRPVLFGTTEVTVAQFRRFAEETGYKTTAETDGVGGGFFDQRTQTTVFDKSRNWKSPGFLQTNDDVPVVQMTYPDICEFCNWLSRREGLKPVYENAPTLGWVRYADADGYRLPTEAEWEFACRAGTTTTYFWGDQKTEGRPDGVDDYAWHRSNLPPDRSHAAVATKRPNPFGLYDLLGNAAELCEDFWDAYGPNAVVDPLTETKNAGDVRVQRGDWHVAAWFRSAGRNAAGSSWSALDGRGFRVVRSAARSIEQVAVATPVPTAADDSPPAVVRLTDRSPDRAAAEWVLSLGGEVTIAQEGAAERTCTRREELPAAAFKLLRITNLKNASQVRDADLTRLKVLRSLKQFEVERVPITTAGLRNLDNCPLESISLAETRCGRDVVDWLLTRPTLKMILLKNASLQDEDVRRMATLPELTQLRLYENETLSDEAIRFALGAKKLDSLAVRSDQLTDAGLRLMLADPRIATVDVGSRRITDAALDGVASRKHITSLSLFHTAITDRGVEQLRGHSELRILYLHDTNVTDGSIDVPASLPKLKLVAVGGSGVTAFGVHRLKQLRPDVTIEVRMPLAPPPQEEAARNRKAAEWVLSVGGTLTILVADAAGVAARPIAKPDELPPGEFLVDAVVLSKLPQVKDEDLVRLRDLSALREFRISEAPITVAGLRNMGRLPLLSFLQISYARIAGDIVPWLSEQTSLATLQIGNARLTDADVSKISTLPGLRGIALYGCPELTDQAVRALADNPRLTFVHVDSKRLTNEAVRMLIDAPHVTSLRITSGAITDEVGPWLRRAERLTSIELYGTQIGDATIRQFEGMPNLETLAIKQTRVTDACIDSLITLPKLRYVVLGDSGITQAGVDRLRAAKPACEIKIEGKLAPAAQ